MHAGNMKAGSDPSEGSERKGESWSESSYLLRKYINNHKQDVGKKNMGVKSNSTMVSGENEEHVTGNWREGDPCYEVAENSAKLCPRVL